MFPCSDGDLHMKKKQKQAELVSNFMTKYKNTVGAAAGVGGGDKQKPAEKPQSVADKYTFTPQDFKYENKHYKYIKYTKHDNKINKVCRCMGDDCQKKEYISFVLEI